MERKNENRKKSQETETRERGIGMASRRWGLRRKEKRESERASGRE